MGKLDTSGFEDIQLQCKDADHKGDRSFWWEKGEQAFMHQLASEGKLQGTLTEPKRCKDCRARRRNEREARENRDN